MFQDNHRYIILKYLKKYLIMVIIQENNIILQEIIYGV